MIKLIKLNKFRIQEGKRDLKFKILLILLLLILHYRYRVRQRLVLEDRNCDLFFFPFIAFQLSMICCARFWCSAAWCHGLRQTLAFHLNLWVYLTHNFGCLCFISDWLGHPAACCCVSVFAFHEAPDQPRHRAVMENFGFSFRHVVAWDEAFLRKTRHWKSEILIEIWNLIICMPYAICNANATRKFRFGLEILLTNYPLSLYSVHSYYKLLLLSYYWLISTHWLIDSLSLLITNIFSDFSLTSLWICAPGQGSTTAPCCHREVCSTSWWFALVATSNKTLW